MRIRIPLLMSMVVVAKAPDFPSPYLVVGFDRHVPGFSFFAVDGLGEGKLADNYLAPLAVFDEVGDTHSAAR